jgi:ATP-dependent protease HslVU (ClpYQ) peptidase subunit
MGSFLSFYTQTTAAARALMDLPDLSAEDVAKKAMHVASEMCVYTNQNFRIEIIRTEDEVVKTAD